MISVCIATYNSSKYIIEQLKSIISQLSNEDEIIVSDDGSQDDTLEKISSLKDNRIKIYRNNGPHGYTANFENALKMANGNYIFLSDHDDVWMPNKVEECLKILKDYYFVVSDAIVTDENLTATSNSFFRQQSIHKCLIGNLLRFRLIGCLQAFRKEILEKALPFPRNHSLCTHDNWLYMIGKTYYNVKILDLPLIYYRRHDCTVSKGGINEHKNILFRITYRLYLIINLAARLFT